MDWDLSALYEDFDEKYVKDYNYLEKLIQRLDKISRELELNNSDASIKNFIQMLENITLQFEKLHSFSNLILTTDYKNEQAREFEGKLSLLINKIIEPKIRFLQYLNKIDDLSVLIEKDEFLHKYRFLLKQFVRMAGHTLSEREESVLTNMQIFSSNSWTNLQSIITSNAKTQFDQENLTLTNIRNLAYHPDQKVRMKAYEEELKMYEYMEDVCAVTLSNIKREANYLAEIRKFKDVRDMTLFYSNMKENSLNQMLLSIQRNLPIFDKYFKAKAKYLKHEKGLPFYDLFAPIGEYKEQFTLETAKKYVLDSFEKFSPKLKDLALKAFDNNWMDFYPKENKVGGAFCANLLSLNQSRILLNYNHSLGDLQTISHELGHAYHNSIINEEAILNREYSMLTAETASTLCQLIFTDYVYQKSESKEEKLYLLENQLIEESQSIVDIYSRYIFEMRVIEETRDKELSATTLKKMMEEAQIECYNHNLDEDYLHPYMWICKSHYYSSTLNFYNFPYAFGLLFARGLYRKYKQNPQEFIQRYDSLLAQTGKDNLENILGTFNISLNNTDFFDSSFAEIKYIIDEYVSLIEND